MNWIPTNYIIKYYSKSMCFYYVKLHCLPHPCKILYFFNLIFNFFSVDLVLIQNQLILISHEKINKKKGIEIKKISNISGMP
jgi:hypothetical protein